MALDPVRATAIGSALLALLVLAAYPILSMPVAAGLAIGLLLGSVNPVLARRGLAAEMPFRATSTMRLLGLSVVGIAVGLLLGAPFATLLGVAGAQFVLVAASTFASIRR
ncbi:MAG TPA: hypothetical protein VIO86_07925 [Candidatus Dormibacteraeota bacterium]|jgi:uncharacterized transporter YbjL